MNYCLLCVIQNKLNIYAFYRSSKQANILDSNQYSIEHLIPNLSLRYCVYLTLCKFSICQKNLTCSVINFWEVQKEYIFTLWDYPNYPNHSTRVTLNARCLPWYTKSAEQSRNVLNKQSLTYVFLASQSPKSLPQLQSCLKVYWYQDTKGKERLERWTS